VLFGRRELEESAHLVTGRQYCPFAGGDVERIVGAGRIAQIRDTRTVVPAQTKDEAPSAYLDRP